jgi:hypothetical protein
LDFLVGGFKVALLYNKNILKNEKDVQSYSLIFNRKYKWMLVDWSDLD